MITGIYLLTFVQGNVLLHELYNDLFNMLPKEHFEFLMSLSYMFGNFSCLFDSLFMFINVLF